LVIGQSRSLGRGPRVAILSVRAPSSAVTLTNVAGAADAYSRGFIGAAELLVGVHRIEFAARQRDRRRRTRNQAGQVRRPDPEGVRIQRRPPPTVLP